MSSPNDHVVFQFSRTTCSGHVVCAEPLRYLHPLVSHFSDPRAVDEVVLGGGGAAAHEHGVRARARRAGGRRRGAAPGASQPGGNTGTCIQTNCLTTLISW